MLAYSMTVNGAGINNRKIEFRVIGSNSPPVFCSFVVTAQKTGIYFDGGSYQVNEQSINGVTTFAGNTAGQLDKSNTDKDAVTVNIEQKPNGEMFTSAEQSGTINITSYGIVECTIKETISGTMMYSLHRQL